MIAKNLSTPNMPRFEMEKEPPWNSSGLSRLARARPASSRTCARRGKMDGWGTVCRGRCLRWGQGGQGLERRVVERQPQQVSNELAHMQCTPRAAPGPRPPLLRWLPATSGRPPG